MLFIFINHSATIYFYLELNVTRSVSVSFLSLSANLFSWFEFLYMILVLKIVVCIVRAHILMHAFHLCVLGFSAAVFDFVVDHRRRLFVRWFASCFIHLSETYQTEVIGNLYILPRLADKHKRSCGGRVMNDWNCASHNETSLFFRVTHVPLHVIERLFAKQYVHKSSDKTMMTHKCSEITSISFSFSFRIGFVTWISFQIFIALIFHETTTFFARNTINKGSR